MRLAWPVIFVLLHATAAEAQSDRFRIAVRAGSAAIANDAYEVVYDEAMTLAGVSAGLLMRNGWSLSVAAEQGEVAGYLTLIDPPLPTANATSFSLRALHLTAAKDFPVGRRWGMSAGGGLTHLAWEEENDFATTDGAAVGGHVVARFHVRAGRVDIGPEVMYWIVPELFEDAGGAAESGDRDLSAVQVGLTAGVRF